MLGLACSCLFRKTSTSLLATYSIIVILFAVPVAGGYFAQNFFPAWERTPTIRQATSISPFATAFEIPLFVRDMNDDMLWPEPSEEVAVPLGSATASGESPGSPELESVGSALPACPLFRRKLGKGGANLEVAYEKRVDELKEGSTISLQPNTASQLVCELRIDELESGEVVIISNGPENWDDIKIFVEGIRPQYSLMGYSMANMMQFFRYVGFTLTLNAILFAGMVWLFNRRWRVSTSTT